MIRRYPQIRGKVDSVVENEIKSTIDSLYDTIELLAKSAGISLDVSKSATPSTIQQIRQQPSNTNQQQSSVGLQSGVFAQAQIGQAADPNLKPNIPADYLFSDMKLVSGAVAVGGKVSVSDGQGHTFNFLVE